MRPRFGIEVVQQEAREVWGLTAPRVAQPKQMARPVWSLLLRAEAR